MHAVAARKDVTNFRGGYIKLSPHRHTSQVPSVGLGKERYLLGGGAGEEAHAAVLRLVKGEAAQRGARLLLHPPLIIIAACPGAPRPLACMGWKEQNKEATWGGRTAWHQHSC